MKATVIRIGTSCGVRIPKALLEQCRLRDTVELEVDDGHLVIRPAEQAQAGWDEASSSPPRPSRPTRSTPTSA